MKINILKFIGFFIMVAFIASCDKEAFEEYSSVPAKAAPTLTVTIDGYTDSTMTVTYNLSVAGRVTLAVMPTSVDTPSIASIENRTVTDLDYIKYCIHDDGNATGTVTFNKLKEYTSYRVFGVGHNTDGVVSSLVITDPIRTEDFANPVITKFSPAKGELVLTKNAEMKLTFNEPVFYNSGKIIRLSSDGGTYDELITSDEIEINGNVVNILHSDWPYEDYINLEIEQGTFTDATGNECAAINLYPVSPNYWFELGVPPASEFIGTTWECTEYSLYGGGETYNITITPGETEDELVLEFMWSALTSGGSRIIPIKLLFNQEEGTVICPFQETGYTYYGYPINIVYSNAWSAQEGVYGSYGSDYITFDAKLYAEGLGIFDQVQFELVPTTKSSEGKTNITSKELSVPGVDKIKERF